MNKKLFVGRLPFAFSNDQLRALFIKLGTVVSAVMVPDAKSGRTRGFGFVDMSTETEAQAAIQAVNGIPLEDKKIWVTLAREKGEEKKPAPFPKSNRPPFGERGPRRDFADRPTSSAPGRRTFTDRSPSRSANERPSFGPKRHSPSSPASGRRPAGNHFTDSTSSAPTGGSRPPFRGKRPFPGGDARSAGAPAGERRPFRGNDARPGGPPRASGPSSFPKKEFRPRNTFSGPSKKAGGRRPPPRG